MNKKVRLTNSERAMVRDSIIRNLVKMGLDESTATAAATRGSPCMADAICRRIARGPGYAVTRTVTPEMFNLAFANWVAYKCGVREEESPAEAEAPAATVTIRSGIMTDPEDERTARIAEAPSTKPATPREVLAANGATEIEYYSLVNNDGYTFVLNGKRYDARYWANCYGTALNRWEVMGMADSELKTRLENALNATRAA